MAAQSQDSVPPAPALMLSIASLLSCSPPRRDFTSKEPASDSSLSRSPAISGMSEPPSASEEASSSISSRSAALFSKAPMGSVRSLRDESSSTSPWARSRASQKEGSAMCPSISAMRESFPAASKIPPHL